MAIEIKSGVDTNLATVDSNKALRVATSTTSANNGILAHTNRSDSGSVSGTALDIDPESDEDYRARVAQDSILFYEPFAGTALNSAAFSSTVSTMTTAVSGGFVKLNSGSAVGTSNVARVTSYKCIPFANDMYTYATFPFSVQAASVGISNTTWEVGFFFASGITAPTDGVFLRCDSTGTLKLVLNFNGTETTSSAISASYIPVNTVVKLLLVVSQKVVRLWINDVLIASVSTPTSTTFPTWSTALPFCGRIYNASGASPATATQIWIGAVECGMSGNGAPFNGEDLGAASGFMGIQGISGGTMGSTANYANSAGPASATLSNTAAGYTTLGGQWQFAAVSGAETDYCLFAYTVPAAAAGSHNRGLLIRGVSISSMNTVVAVATTATVMQWGIAVGSTAVTLATGEGATTKAARRYTLGIQTFPVGATVGAIATDIVRTFNCPLYANPGEVVHILLKMPIATNTATEIFRGTVMVDAQWF